MLVHPALLAYQVPEGPVALGIMAAGRPHPRPELPCRVAQACLQSLCREQVAPLASVCRHLLGRLPEQ